MRAHEQAQIVLDTLRANPDGLHLADIKIRSEPTLSLEEVSDGVARLIRDGVAEAVTLEHLVRRIYRPLLPAADHYTPYPRGV